MCEPVLAPAGSTSIVLPISLSTPLVAPIPPPGQTPMAVHLLGLGSVMINAMLPASPDGCASPDPRVRWAWAVCRPAVPLAAHRSARGGAVPDGAAPVRGGQVPRSSAGRCAPYPAVLARRRGHGDQWRAEDFHAAGLGQRRTCHRE